MAVKKRCNFCLELLRADGTCANPDCPRYVPEDNTQNTQEKNSTEESKEGKE